MRLKSIIPSGLKSALLLLDAAPAAGDARPRGKTECDKPVIAALQRCRSAFIGLGVFSCLTNLLMLTGPIFMMQVYDRVLTSGSIPTLVALLALVTLLYLFYGLIELVRARILIRVGRRWTSRFHPWCSKASWNSHCSGPPKMRPRARFVISMHCASSFPARDRWPYSICPWVPVYLLILFLFSPDPRLHRDGRGRIAFCADGAQ